MVSYYSGGHSANYLLNTNALSKDRATDVHEASYTDRQAAELVINILESLWINYTNYAAMSSEI